VLQSSAPGVKSVNCLTPSLSPGFVVVGFAHTTGKTYAPGRDDIGKEQGNYVFEFVQPWRITSVFPEETYYTGGQLLFIQGQHVRPELRCNFQGGSPPSAAIQFVSSGLAVCESAVARSARSTGVLMLQHKSHATPDGQQVNIRHRTLPEVSYTGRSVAAFGDTITVSLMASDEATPLMLSRQAQIGCQFGGVWVAASGRKSPVDIGCTIPASTVGRVQVVVTDLHSRWPLPLTNDTVLAMDSPTSGRFMLMMRAPAVVELITPSAGTPLRSSTMHVDVYGQHLVPKIGLLASLCATLTSASLQQGASKEARPEEVRLKCLVALSAGGKLDSAHAGRNGFNAVMIASGHGVLASFEVQYLLQTPPRIIATTSLSAHAGDVITAVGDDFIEGANPLWCITGSSMQTAEVVSSGVVRCVIPWGGDKAPGSTLHRSSSAGQLKVGVISGETVQSTSNVVSIIWWPHPPEVSTVVPNVGFSHGGAQVVISAEKGSVAAARLQSSMISCRFGTVAAISASLLTADAIACTSPALAPGVVFVGIPAGNVVEYRVLDAPSMVVTVTTTVTPLREGIAELSISSSASRGMGFGCVLPSLRHETPIAAHPSARGRFFCSLPPLQLGFSVVDAAVTLFGTPDSGSNLKFRTPLGSLSTVPMPHLDHHASMPSKGVGRVHHDAEIQVSPPAPVVFVQRPGHSGETYPGDPIFVIAVNGGFPADGRVWCMISTESSRSHYGGGTKSRVPATVISSALALCELPSSHSHEAGTLVDATLRICASHACGGTNAVASAQDGARFVVDLAERTLNGVSPSHGSGGGGEAVKIRHEGPALDSSRHHSVCRMGAIGPISASTTASPGDTAELDCVSPAHAPGVVSVAVGRGAGWMDDVMLTYTFVADAEDAEEDDTDYSSRVTDQLVILHNNASSSTSTSTCGEIPSGDIAAVNPSCGSSEGGIKIVLAVAVVMSTPVDECGMQRASCRVGTVWPVLGYMTPQGVSCTTPAHAPGTADVTALKMVSGLGRPFEYRNTALLAGEAALDDTSSTMRNNPHNQIVQYVKSSPKTSVPGAYVDGTTTDELIKEKPACVFASPVRASIPWMFTAAAHIISSIIVRCETPASFQTIGLSIVDQSQVETSVSFSAYHEAPTCGFVDLSPSTGFAQGGSITRVAATCSGESLTSFDARVGCRYGSLGPIAGTMGDGGFHTVKCVAPAHAPGAAPFALTSNWRDVNFEQPLITQLKPWQYVYKRDKGQSCSSTNVGKEDEFPPVHQSHNYLPLMSNVAPWLVWGGNILHITGRGLPNNLNAACLVGSSLVAAIPISSALVLCDPFPIPNIDDRPMTSQLAGGMKEVSLSVTDTFTLTARLLNRGEAAPLTMFLISAATVVGVDVVNGWEQGGAYVNVELGGWAPMGLMDCHFGTVAVHGREGGGAGWQSRAAMGRKGEWWSEATVATDVECVTPARQSGSVPIGVSLAHSTSPDFASGNVEYKYF